MTKLQEKRAEIVELQKQLFQLRLRHDELKRIYALEIADPKMREWAKEQIPLKQLEIESTIRAILSAETEESKLT